MELDVQTAVEPPELQIDRRGGVAVWRGGPLVVRAKVWEVLLCFAARPGELVSVDDLRRAVWSDVTVAAKTVHNVVAELRQALSVPDGRAPLETVKRRGYRFTAALQVTPPLSSPPAIPLQPKTPGEPALLPRLDLQAQLYACWHGSLLHGARIAALFGEPGAGKSTVLHGFLDLLAGDPASGGGPHSAAVWPLVAMGCCADRADDPEPYGPLLMALGAVLAARPTTPGLMQRLAPTWLLQFPGIVDPAEAEQLHRMCAGSSPARRSREGVALFEALAAEDPLVLAIEDLHWADADTVDVLSALARMGRRVPLFIVTTLRRYPSASSAALAPRLEGLRRLATQVDVPRFTTPEVSAYLRLRLDDDFVSPELVALLEERSSGNPLVLRSLWRQLIENRQLRRSDGGWRLKASASFGGHSLSTDVTAVIANQLSALAPHLARVLEASSLIGEEFAVPALAEVLAQPAAAIESALVELTRQEIVRPAGSARFAFAHTVHRQVVRDAIEPGSRAQLQSAIATYLMRRPITPQTPFAPAQIAANLTGAGEWEQASQYFEYAAHMATGRLDYGGALRALESALQCGSRLTASAANEQREAALRLLLANLASLPLSDVGSRIADNFRRAAVLFEKHGCHIEAFRARLGLALTHLGRGEYAEAQRQADQLLATAESGVEGMVAAACGYGGLVYLFLGDLAHAEALLRRGLQEPISPELPRMLDLRGTMLMTLASALTLRGDFAAARRTLEEGLATADQNFIPVAGGLMLLQVAMVAAYMADPSLTQRLAERASEFAERYVMLRGQPLAIFFQNWLDPYGRGGVTALAAMEASIASHIAGDGGWLVSHLRSLLAESYLEAGDAANAAHCVELGLAAAEASGEGLFRAELYRLRAHCQLSWAAPGAIVGGTAAVQARAVADFQRAIDLAQSQGAVLFEQRAQRDLHQLLDSRTTTGFAAKRGTADSQA
ncbi:MAG: AAA family ATPase [bacterium]